MNKKLYFKLKKWTSSEDKLENENVILKKNDDETISIRFSLNNKIWWFQRYNENLDKYSHKIDPFVFVKFLEDNFNYKIKNLNNENLNECLNLIKSNKNFFKLFNKYNFDLEDWKQLANSRILTLNKLKEDIKSILFDYKNIYKNHFLASENYEEQTWAKYNEEKSLEKILEQNPDLLGYDFTLEQYPLKSFFKSDVYESEWKPDLVFKRKNDVLDFYELKTPFHKVLNYDNSHKNYYFRSSITKAVSQAENQFDAFIKQLYLQKSNDLIISKNSKVYLILGNLSEELNREPSDIEFANYQKMSKEEAKIAIRHKKQETIELLRNSFKNVEIIFYDEISN